jgi:hypothetical protein
MRTTLKLSEDAQRTLRAIANARGERGVARVVAEAVALYLTDRNRPAELAPTPPTPGRWQRIGAEMDRRLESLENHPGVVAIVRAVVRDGWRRLATVATH